MKHIEGKVCPAKGLRWKNAHEVLGTAELGSTPPAELFAQVSWEQNIPWSHGSAWFLPSGPGLPRCLTYGYNCFFLLLSLTSSIYIAGVSVKLWHSLYRMTRVCVLYQSPRPTPDAWYRGSTGAVKWRSHWDQEREEHLTGSFQGKAAR